jgi:hypothetical protein
LSGKGFSVPPLAIINLIKDNLADRYRDIYSVLKEIIQNADDADSATFLDICWISGISAAKHPLLSGPALLFINNGIFEIEDAKAIRQIGLSGKSSEKYSIGKFGLGLKSIFHLCEAFFYISSHTQPVKDDYRYNLINPWSGEDSDASFHTDWDDLSLAPPELLENVINKITKDERWFCIWVPLRQKIHGVERKRKLREELIITDLFCGDLEHPPDDLFNDDIEIHLSTLLPLLQNIESIRLWSTDGQNEPRILSSIKLRDGSIRRRYPNLSRGNSLPFSGYVDIKKKDPQIEKNIFFAGIEQVLDNPILQELQNRSEWPKTVSYSNDGLIKHEKEKADSHCAVYFVDKKGSMANLDLQWSVFLPLSGDRTSLVCDEGDFELFLHGYFFIDAGRSQVDFSNSYGSTSGGRSLNIREEWNQMLKNEGIYPLILRALDGFVKSSQIKLSQINAITEAISKSILIKSEKESICSKHQWGYFLKQPRNEWALIGSEELFYELPSTPVSAPMRHCEVFPRLLDLLSDHFFLFTSTPRISLRTKGHPWTEELLHEILDIDVPTIFSHKGKLEYLIEFLNHVRVKLDTSKIQNRLLELAKGAFKNLERDILSRNKSLVQEFISFIMNNKRFSLYLDESRLSDRVIPKLQDLNLEVLIVPKEFDPDSEGKEGSGTIATNDGEEILKLFAQEVDQQNCSDEEDKLVNTVLFQILDSIGFQREEFFTNCRDLKIFSKYDCKENQVQYVTYDDLVKAKKDGHLFVYSMPPNRFGLAYHLQRVLTTSSIWLIKTDLAKALFPGDLPTTCDALGALVLLANKPSLTGNVNLRAQLVTNIFRQSPETWNETLKNGIRYLLHARKMHFENQSNLLLDLGESSTEVWARIYSYILRQYDNEWKIIPREVAKEIASVYWNSLGLVPANGNTIQLIFQEYDATRMNFDGLSGNDRRLIIKEVSDIELLKRLRIHETTMGRLVSIDKATYLQDRFVLENSLLDTIKVLTRFNDDPVLEIKQTQLCLVLDERAAIEIACKHEKPHLHWRTIMEALEVLGSKISQDRDLLSMLRQTKWIPATNQRNVDPKDVIYIEELQDDISRILPLLDIRYINVETIADEIKDHKAFKIFKNHVLLNQEQALSFLAGAMSKNEKFLIGKISIKDLTVDAFVAAFQGISFELMSSFSIISSIYVKNGSKACERFLQSGIIDSIKRERTISYLNFLAANHEKASAANKENYSKTYNFYLSAGLVGLESTEQLRSLFLTNINLLSRKGKWKHPGELCFDARGIDEDDILDIEQSQILNQAKGFFTPTNIQGASVDDDTRYVDEKDLDDTADILKNYFLTWQGSIQREAIGGFLSFLGNHRGILALAQEYLGNFSVEYIRSSVDWQPMRARYDLWGGELIEDVMKKTAFILEPVDNKTVSVVSLLGTKFEARVGENLDHLLVFSRDKDSQAYKYITRGDTRIIRLGLRKPDPNNYSREDLSEILHQTAMVLLTDIFRQNNPNLRVVWEDLAQSEQLDIKIAQNLILESAFFYLKILGLHTHEKLKEPVSLWEGARRKKAEEDHRREKGRITRQGGQNLSPERTMRDALEKLKSLITEDEDVQALILSAVHNKMKNQYQYRYESIPFELFQNADDAVVELRNNLNEDMKTFIVSCTEKELTFAHRGRLINQFWIGSFDGRTLGYDRDLEKMLVLSSSDKPLENTSHNDTVTGKFGLGFKSVFLVTSSPKILSGQLGFKVLGGIFPEKIVGDEFIKLKNNLQKFSGSEKSGTIFEVPLNSGIDPNNIISEFLQYSSICLIFSKGIKSCEFHSHKENRIEHIAWEEKPLLNSNKIFIGTIPKLSENELRGSTALVIKCEQGSILLAFDARSLKPLSKTIPTIWVTAPTRHILGLGFAVNAAFDLDIGRAQLARDSKRNQDIVIEMGHHIGQALCELADICEHKWIELREVLCLAENAEAYTFWESFWKVFAESIYKQKVAGENGQEVMTLLESMLWGDSTSGMQKAIGTKRLLPSGLWNEYKALTSTTEVQYRATDSLDAEETFLTVSSWDSFKRKVKPGSIISEKRICSVLNALTFRSFNLNPIDLSTILRWEIGEQGNVGAQKAQKIGSVITREFLTVLRQGNEGQQKELAKLQTVTQSAQFRARNEAYYNSRDLLIGVAESAEYREENMRAAFAPDDRVLDDHYTGDALAFFEACRPQMTAHVDEMVEWAINANEAKKKSALLYLLSGEHHDVFGYKIFQRLEGTWIDELVECDLLNQLEFNTWEQQIILGRLRMYIKPPTPVGPVIIKCLEPKRVIEDIYDWWSTNNVRLMREYESRVYPDEYLDELDKLSFYTENLSHNSDAREMWLTLFLIGTFHTLGRTKEGQHREFIRRCKQRGWMAVFSDPQKKPEDWISVIDQYLDEQVDDTEFLQWMKQFVSIYGLARQLEDYIEAFLTINTIREPFSLDNILRTSSSVYFQGGGIFAPTVSRILGMGACFVLRELVRKGIIKNDYSYPYCYVPARRVRRLLASMGCGGLEEININRWEISKNIHQFLTENIGSEKAVFDFAFDIPFLEICREPELQDRFLKHRLPDEDDSI